MAGIFYMALTRADAPCASAIISVTPQKQSPISLKTPMIFKVRFPSNKVTEFLRGFQVF